jgi:hypothetical protein
LAVLLAAVLLFSGCDAIKGLLGEDSGPDGGGGGSSAGVPVAFEEIAVAEGGTTTLVTLVFDKDIPGLSDRDVTITSAGDTGAVAGVLSPTEVAGAYTLAVSGVKETGEIAISVGKSGYTFTPATQKAVVNFDEVPNKVTFVGAIANGTAGSQTTTALILTFNATFATPFQPGDITLWPGSTGAAMGGLAPSGDGAYMLAVSDVAAEGEVTVTVVKEGYAVSPATVTAAVHYKTAPLAGGGTVTLMPVEDDFSQVWEIHTFTADGSLDFGGVPPNVTAQVLVVAGGGGGGAGRYPASGAGAGGMVENSAYPLTAASYAVVVGAGGIGGTGGTSDADTTHAGTNGGDSSFGGSSIVARGGGTSGPRFYDMTAGYAGGSSGGGNSSPAVLVGTGGTSYGNRGGLHSGNKTEYAGGGGGAGGPGTVGQVDRSNFTPRNGGAGKASSITGTSVIYAAGGPIPLNTSSTGVNGAANTGNGGGGGWNKGGGNGGSGIVVIRFQRPK